MGIAATIASQIGSRALYMLGAKNLTDTGRGPTELGGLSFKVGRNAKGVTHVKVGLRASDTYTVRFIRCGRAPSFKITTLEEVEGVYFDGLREVIERGTGMATSL